jgi:hypothetical protein
MDNSGPLAGVIMPSPDSIVPAKPKRKPAKKKAPAKKPKTSTKTAAMRRAVVKMATAKVPERSERMDLRLSKKEKARIKAKAAKLRRTLTSLFVEFVERL